MTAVLAVTAFIIALGAIWFTSEAVSRVDARNGAMVKPFLGRINASVDKNHETLVAMKMRMERLEKEIRLLKLKADISPGIEQETAIIQSGLNGLERFTPTIRLNG